MFEARIIRLGKNLSVAFPVALARELDFREGDTVRLRRIDSALVIEPSRQARLRARLATVRYKEAEVGTGSLRNQS